jgi:ATP synthase protein I
VGIQPTFAWQRHALRVVAWQVAFAALAATAIAALSGLADGAAALLGGGIAGTGSLAYVFASGGGEARLEPRLVLRAHLRAEAIKLSVSIAGLAVALGSLPARSAWPLIVGFVVALHGYFAALWFDRN